MGREDSGPGGKCSGGKCAGRKMCRDENMPGGFCARRKVCIRKNSLGKILGGLFSVGNKVTIDL